MNLIVATSFALIFGTIAIYITQVNKEAKKVKVPAKNKKLR